ncbi:MAG: metallophosphoesterase [Actinomycetota bacterium]|nr:metallophosphoesterase [Actinomycetota bacterium]
MHANLPALQAALAALRDRGADGLLVAGDLVGYGAQPNECVDVLAEAEARCVAGNHDLFVLGRLPPTRFPAIARRSAEVTRALLRADTRSFLGSLPLTLRAGAVLVSHGSPDDPEEYVTEEGRAQELLRRLPNLSPPADTLVLGHTHRQWCVVGGRGALPARGLVQLPVGSRLLNPGSVGQSRERERTPGARCAVYDTVAATVEFIRTDYDVAASRRALRGLDLPDESLHAPPRLRGRVMRASRRIMRRAAGRRSGRP